MPRTNPIGTKNRCRIYYLLRYAAAFAALFFLLRTGPAVPAAGALLLPIVSFVPAFGGFLRRCGMTDENAKAVLRGLREICAAFLLVMLFIYLCGRPGFDGNLFRETGILTGLTVLAAGTFSAAVIDFRSLKGLLTGRSDLFDNTQCESDRCESNGCESNGYKISLFEKVQKKTSKEASPIAAETLAALPVRFCLLVGVSLYAFSEMSVSADLSVSGLMASPAVAELLFFAIVAVLTASLVDIVLNPARTVSLFSGVFLVCLTLFLTGYEVGADAVLFALVFSGFLGVLAYVVRIGDISAALGATLLGFLIVLYSSPEWYLLVLTFFILGGAFTKYRYRDKEKMGLAEGKKGVRTYENVFANTLPALCWAVAYGVAQAADADGLSVMFSLAFIGTVANALGDTMASEIGTTSKGATYMITTLRKSKPGEDGGVSLLGEVSCLAGCLIIGILAWALSLTPTLLPALAAALAGGLIGTNFDSFLGATLQKKGYLSNSGVNLLSTAVSGFPAAAVYFFLI